MQAIDLAYRASALDEMIDVIFFLKKFFFLLWCRDLIFPLSEVDSSVRMALYTSVLGG